MKMMTIDYQEGYVEGMSWVLLNAQYLGIVDNKTFWKGFTEAFEREQDLLRELREENLEDWPE